MEETETVLIDEVTNTPPLCQIWDGATLAPSGSDLELELAWLGIEESTASQR